VVAQPTSVGKKGQDKTSVSHRTLLQPLLNLLSELRCGVWPTHIRCLKFP
jgi:hypothetical protein